MGVRGYLFEKNEQGGKEKYICALRLHSDALPPPALPPSGKFSHYNWLIEFVPTGETSTGARLLASLDDTPFKPGKEREEQARFLERIVAKLKGGLMGVVHLEHGVVHLFSDSNLPGDIRSLNGTFIQGGKRVHQSRAPDAPGLHPIMLQTLTHMHDWKFGALAELVDNSRDAKAKNVYITYEQYMMHGKAVNAITVTDDGDGMTREEIVRMMSFGHLQPPDETRIGRFGIGFKHGSIKLGKDVAVFSKCAGTNSVGFLSCTHNEGKSIMSVPITTWDKNGQRLHDTGDCLGALKSHSPFSGEMGLGEEMAKIKSNTGTRVVIFNLDMSSQRLDARGDDIVLLPQLVVEPPLPLVKLESPPPLETAPSIDQSKSTSSKDASKTFIRGRASQIAESVPEDYSLRAYLAILFKDHRPNLHLQGTPVIARDWVRYLRECKKYSRSQDKCNVVFGESDEEKRRGNCGMVIYWRNRAVELFHRVGLQLGSEDGVQLGLGIIGVVDVSPAFIPKNNKQGFNDSPMWRDLQDWLADELKDYFYTFRKLGRVEKKNVGVSDGFCWNQCVKCHKWRQLPPGTIMNAKMQATWTCKLNPDPNFNACHKAANDNEKAMYVKCSRCRKVRELQPGVWSWPEPWRCDLNPYPRFYGNPAACDEPQLESIATSRFGVDCIKCGAQRTLPPGCTDWQDPWDCSMYPIKSKARCGISDSDEEEARPHELVTWITCDACGKQRSLPPEVEVPGEDEKWYCYQHPDPTKNSCSAPQESSAGHFDLGVRTGYQSKDQRSKAQKNTTKKPGTNGKDPKKVPTNKTEEKKANKSSTVETTHTIKRVEGKKHSNKPANDKNPTNKSGTDETPKRRRLHKMGDRD